MAALKITIAIDDKLKKLDLLVKSKMYPNAFDKKNREQDGKCFCKKSLSAFSMD